MAITIDERYHQLIGSIREKTLACGRLPQEVTVVVVSKSYPVEQMEEVYRAGGRDFGESRVQEALEKIPHLPKECRWHLIGNLQSNKVAKAVSLFPLIHSVDSPELAKKISQASQAQEKTISILLQVNTSGEKTKQGLSPKEWETQLEKVIDLSHVNIAGLMTIGPNLEDSQIIRKSFRELYELREKWSKRMKNPQTFRHLSMGMSNDYLIAIEEGATLLRLGHAIFGPRS